MCNGVTRRIGQGSAQHIVPVHQNVAGGLPQVVLWAAGNDDHHSGASDIQHSTGDTTSGDTTWETSKTRYIYRVLS